VVTKFGKKESQIQNATLRVIGDRAAGKTTYMAALARSIIPPNSPVQSVTPFGEDSKSLVAMAQNVLEQGLEPEPSPLDSTLDLKDYGLTITLRDQFGWSFQGARTTTLNIACKDYPGEFLRDLIFKPESLRFQDYLEDCVRANGLLLLLDGTAYRKDKDYATSVEQLLLALDQENRGASRQRIAIALSKCEQPELWVHRFQPQKAVHDRFPKLCAKLATWQQDGAIQTECFTLSAYGSLGTYTPEPNMRKTYRDQGGTRAVLKNPRLWQPFGLVAPLYWLCTNKRHPGLDKE
jgi:hypothetical protein